MGQKEMLNFKQDYEYCSVKSKDAVHMMNEMRKSHLQEVRLLQRGLAQRGDEKMRNRVNEVADLVDKLGRAVVQRDEAIKEKTKLQAQLHQIKSESKTLHEERLKLLSPGAPKDQVLAREVVFGMVNAVLDFVIRLVYS